MSFVEFKKFLKKNCMYETIYTDSDGREIIILKVIDVFCLVNDAIKKEKQHE
jgi:hypothetical protein